VDNEVFRRDAGPVRRCRCGAEYLPETGAATHVRHTLSCFLRHHAYVRLADRDGVHEYVCVRCGHPLVFPAGSDRFADRDRFAKKVRYACGLLGHRVTAVATRDGFVEYACHCGHSFLKPAAGARKIRHPLICVWTAHRIRFLTRRAGYAEYVCEDCGHPFCFAGGPGPGGQILFFAESSYLGDRDGSRGREPKVPPKGDIPAKNKI
jgi:DNA-directed RNA polymerase subunit RPC12/RpoP